MSHPLTISFTDEQSMLLDTAGEFFRVNSPVEYVRAQIETETGFDAGIWTQMAELGWLGLAVPEAFGGSGLGLAEAVTIAEPMGRHLFAGPFLSTQLAICALVHGGTDAQKGEWLPRLAGGEIATVALLEAGGDWDLSNVNARAQRDGDRVRLHGAKTFVADAAVAAFVVVLVSLEGSPGLVLVERERISDDALTREVVIDETRRCYGLNLEGIEVPATSVLASAPIETVGRAGTLLLTAEMCGGISATLDCVVEYLNTRTQFGRQIGSYQALKHPTVDILVGLERSRSHLYHAASVINDERLADTAVRMAKAEASDAFAFAGDRAIQFHGGFGFTYECDAQLYLRRALWCQYQFGDALHHRKRLAKTLL